MAFTTADIRKGLCMKHDGKLHIVLEFQHVKPGKGPAFVRTKLKCLENGKIIDFTFSSGHNIEPVRIENREYQYLYPEGEGFVFMNTETFEQVNISEFLVEGKEFMREGEIVNVLFNADDETPLSCELKPHLVFEIASAEDAVKGNTATNATKKATIETGAEINVPLFIKQGDFVKIDTRTGEYLERVSADKVKR